MQALQALVGRWAALVHLAHLELKVQAEEQAVKVKLARKGIAELQVHAVALDLLVLKDCKESLVSKVPLVLLEMAGLKDRKVRLETLEHVGQPVHLEQRELRELPALTEELAHLDQQDQRVHMARADPKVAWEVLELSDNQDLQDTSGLADHAECRVKQARQDQRALMVL